MKVLCHILTGEYPPMPGGVADYTRRVAAGLARAGGAVTVWAPAGCDGSVGDPGVVIRCLPDHFGRHGRAVLDREIPSGARVLVQYVPHAFGAKSMNTGLAGWLWRRRRRWAIDVMFHEVAMPFGLPGGGVRLLHNLPAVVHRAMAAMLVRASQRVFVSTEAWRGMVERAGRRAIVLPVFSNLPETNAEATQAMRRELIGGRDRLVGHFGSCHTSMRGALRSAVEASVSAGARFVFIGGGSAKAGEAIRNELRAGRDDVVVTDRLRDEAASAAVSACDLMVLPYPDGVTTRRSSAMAALAAGVAVVTTTGALTEGLWAESGGVALVPTAHVEEVGKVVGQLLGDAGQRAALADRGHELYCRRFAIEHTLQCIQGIAVESKRQTCG